jgi:hypothetical protein
MDFHTLPLKSVVRAGPAWLRVVTSRMNPSAEGLVTAALCTQGCQA